MLYASVSWTAAFSAICTAVAAPLLNRASLTVGTLLEPSTKPRSSGLRSGI